MIQAILYQTNTGSTEQYAKLLGEAVGLPVCPLAKKRFRMTQKSFIWAGSWRTTSRAM